MYSLLLGRLKNEIAVGSAKKGAGKRKTHKS